MNKLLFVCTGNLCRSPTAETIFNALAEEHGLDWRAESAGLAAVEGEPVPENVGLALGEVGFYADEHRARKVESRMIGEADLVLAMTPRQTEKIARLAGSPGEDRLHTLTGYLGEGGSGEVPDPHGYPLSTHRASVRRIYDYVERLVERLRSLP